MGHAEESKKRIKKASKSARKRCKKQFLSYLFWSVNQPYGVKNEYTRRRTLFIHVGEYKNMKKPHKKEYERCRLLKNDICDIYFGDC